MTLIYTINGTTLTSLGVYISESEGILDVPRVKSALIVDIPSLDGVRVLDSQPKFDGRNITLRGWMKAADADTFNTNMQTLTELLTGGVLTMSVSGFSSPLSYTVMCTDGVQVDKKWRDTTMIATIVIKLKEVNSVLWL